MATLVLSTVGTAIGGPVGGAIGSLVGQSIDQTIFGSANRGPRLSDLSVQTSSYGTQVPRIYGTMRVAGCIVWSTDLVESTQTTGAKGQPDATYSYSVSFAVALSSRPAPAIRRIWADGKLLRGEAGDFKVRTDFRFYDGGEDQIIDPLIASIEGIANTPAYRGLALAVFENFELADFGNRIPFLTFEIEAETPPLRAGAILGDATRGAIDCGVETVLPGYAAFGRTIGDAIEPLVDVLGIDLFDDGATLRSPGEGAAVAIADDHVGCHDDETPAPKIERRQVPSRTLPASVLIGFFDPRREYQAGQARAAAEDMTGVEAKIDVPAVLGAAQARSIGEAMIARRWAERDRIVLRLPPPFSTLQPGMKIVLPESPATWQVARLTIDGMIAIAELRPAWRTTANLPAESGRSLGSDDIVAAPLTLALFDLPDLTGEIATAPRLYLAASRSSAGWKRSSIEIAACGSTSMTRTAVLKSVLGKATSVLGNGQSELLDLSASVDVELIDQEQWLTNCDDQALIQGANLAVVGAELIRFAKATPLGAGRFRLTRLLRGRAGTEWACSSHVAGEAFVLLHQGSVSAITVPTWAKGSMVRARHPGSETWPASTSINVAAASLSPPSPVKLKSTIAPAGGLQISWTRRSRLGWAWVDDIDAPIAEQHERYSVTIAGPGGAAAWQSDNPSLSVPQSELPALGSGPATVAVRQVGDWGASQPVTINITLP